MTPKRLKIYFEAYQLKQKNQDHQMWMMGKYVNIAVIDALSMAFGKGHKSHYPDKPMTVLAEEEEYAKRQDRIEYKGMTEEEKQEAELQRAIDFFNSLAIK